MIRRHFPSLAFALAFLFAVAVFGAAFLYSGAYDIGADSPHSAPVYKALDTLRERSVAVRARDIAVPADLDSPARLATGAGLYGEMCSGCHLGPGIDPTELSQGLYPSAPVFARGIDRSPGEMFWIVKHGVKSSAMPAWGKTHDDQLIWDMVAFARSLPKMSSVQYQAALANAPEDHDEIMGEMPHHHDEATPTHHD